MNNRSGLVAEAWEKSKPGRQSYFEVALIELALSFLLGPIKSVSPLGFYLADNFIRFCTVTGLLFASRVLQQTGSFEKKDLVACWKVENFKVLIAGYAGFLAVHFALSKLLSTFISLSHPSVPLMRLGIGLFSLVVSVSLVFCLASFTAIVQGLSFTGAIRRVSAGIRKNVYEFSLCFVVFSGLPGLIFKETFNALNKGMPWELSLLLVFIIGVLSYYLFAPLSYLLFAFYERCLVDSKGEQSSAS